MTDQSGRRQHGAEENPAEDTGARRNGSGVPRTQGVPSAARARQLEHKVLQLDNELRSLQSQNERLVATLTDARTQIVTLREEVDRLAQPPAGFGQVMVNHHDGTLDIFTSGRKMRVAVSPTIEQDELVPGREVMLNEAMNVVAACGFEQAGEVVTLKELLGEDRMLVVAHADEERVCRVADSLRDQPVRVGDGLLLDTRSGFVYERIPKPEVAELVLEEVPDITYEDIGGLASQIEQIRDAVELPFLHTELYEEHQLRPPKGVLLYGPPGCGKTLIAKAVAASLAHKVAEKEQREHVQSYFLNIKGPELLNKYVGETERHIRLIFQRAREK